MRAETSSLKTSEGILKVNNKGGFYIHGKKLGAKSDIEAYTAYMKIMREKGKCSIRDLGKAINRGHNYSSKIINQLKKNGVLNCMLEENQNESRKKPKQRTTYGSKTFDDIDIQVLLDLRREQPNRTLYSYRQNLIDRTGTVASVSLISKFFLHNFKHSGKLVKSSHVPIDKYKPDNILRALEYKETIQKMDPRRIKFGDEKHLKGSEIFNRKNRRDPVTGMVENTIVTSDFRNTYTIIGFCGITGNMPFFFDLHKSTNTASTFCDAVDKALRAQFLQPGDILVLDNASIHLYKESKNLVDYLYELGILLLFLPARSPELNPIELLWHVLVQRLRHCILPRDMLPSDACALAAKIIMDSFTWDDVERAYMKNGYLRK